MPWHLFFPAAHLLEAEYLFCNDIAQIYTFDT